MIKPLDRLVDAPADAADASDILFSPFAVNGLTLKNRLVMAPMTRSFSPSGVPSAQVVDYYRRRAAGGVGLIVTEGTWVPHPTASNESNVPRFYGEDALNGWEQVVGAVHAAGARIFPQLWHVGLTVKARVEQVFGEDDSSVEPDMGPSGIRAPGGPVEAPPMTQADIDAVVEAFARAAEMAKTLGFDGVEIHGAHGYLIDQFFWPATNRRQDRYGGTAANRARFAAEIVAACRSRVGADFPIALRLSQWKVIDFTARNVETPSALSQMLEPLVEAGVDLFHCSTRRYWEPEFPDSPLNLAGWVKTLTGKPTVTVGSVGLGTEMLESLANPTAVESRGLERLLASLERGEFDLVAVGRALIGDPEWPNKVRAGRGDFAPFSSTLLTSLD